jgi:Domain of unknown function (DUF4162)
VIAEGTPQELKEASRSAHVEVTLAVPHAGAAGAMAPLAAGRVQVSEDGRRLSAGVDAAPGLASALVRALDNSGALVDNIEVRRPTLDDVFFALTGGHIAGDGPADGTADGTGAAGAPRRTDNGHEVREVRA